MYKLGTTTVTDTATGLKGMLTLMQVEMNNTRFYCFQPKGLNPETGKPVEPDWVVPERLKDVEEVPDPELPLEILGSDVEDMASGLKGTAISISYFLSGCVHVNVQPKGRLAKTGAAVAPYNVDIRRLKGPKVPKMTEAEIEADKKKKPSPGEYSPRQFQS